MNMSPETAASYTASINLGVWGLTVNEWVALIGVGLAVATFVVNSIYKHLNYKLNKRREKRANDEQIQTKSVE